jgi:hypothetical protein
MGLLGQRQGGGERRQPRRGGGRRGGLGRLGQNERKIYKWILISNLKEFQIFGRTLEICTKRSRRNLDIEIFPEFF